MLKDTLQQVEKPPITSDQLRKYIAYAKTRVRPRLGEDASKRIQEYYVDLRKAGARGGTVAITPRQIEGLIRMSEASAKTRLSSMVELADAERAIGLSEYVLKTLAMDSGNRRDIDIILTGMPREKVDRMNIIMSIIRKLEETENVAKVPRLVEEAIKEGLDDTTVNKYLGELERSGDIFRPRPGIIKIVKRETE